MFTKRLTLFKLFGFAVKVDATWLFLAILVTWSLASGVFPEEIPGLGTRAYWLMGAGGALGLFLSIALHELGHSLVARRYGIEIRDITLFIFGGVADMKDEPPNARSEFWMAIAGPVTSLLIAIILQAVYEVSAPAQGAVPALEVVRYLAWLNGVLALFNLVPAFPLDGGRVLRAALWSWKRDLRWATRIAAGLGSAFGLMLIVVGFFAFLGGALIAGVWYFMIGMFVRAASQSSYNNVLVRRALEGEVVRRFMIANPVTVAPSVYLDDFVEDWVYQYHHKMYPVVENGRLIGCVTTRDVKQVPKQDWERTTIQDIVRPWCAENSISPNEDAMKALGRMSQSGNSRLLVVEDGRLMGVVALKDLLSFLSLKMDLEGIE